MSAPQIDISTGGWVTESVHVTGSYRMCALWGTALIQGPAVITLLTPRIGLHAAMVVAVLIAVAFIAAGAWLCQVESKKTPYLEETWIADPGVAPSPSTDFAQPEFPVLLGEPADLNASPWGTPGARIPVNLGTVGGTP